MIKDFVKNPNNIILRIVLVSKPYFAILSNFFCNKIIALDITRLSTLVENPLKAQFNIYYCCIFGLYRNGTMLISIFNILFWK